MKKKTFRVLNAVLACDCGYISTQEIAYKTNLTNRQVQSMISILNLPIVHEEFDEKMKVILYRMDGTKEQKEEILKQATRDYYNISDEVIANVYSVLPEDEWTTISAIAAKTDMKLMDVSKTLYVMDGVATKGTGSSILYRRGEPNRESA